MVDLIAGCMHTMASNLLQPSIVTSLIQLLQTFLGCDHTQEKVIVTRFIKRVLLDSALWCTMPRETTVYLHEELHRVFNTPSTQALFTSIIPIQVCVWFHMVIGHDYPYDYPYDLTLSIISSSSSSSSSTTITTTTNNNNNNNNNHVDLFELYCKCWHQFGRLRHANALSIHSQ